MGNMSIFEYSTYICVEYSNILIANEQAFSITMVEVFGFVVLKYLSRAFQCFDLVRCEKEQPLSLRLSC